VFIGVLAQPVGGCVRESSGEDTQRLAWVSAWVRCPLSRLVGLGLHKLLSIAASGLDAYSNLHVTPCHARVAEL